MLSHPGRRDRHGRWRIPKKMKGFLAALEKLALRPDEIKLDHPHPRTLGPHRIGQDHQGHHRGQGCAAPRGKGVAGEIPETPAAGRNGLGPVPCGRHDDVSAMGGYPGRGGRYRPRRPSLFACGLRNSGQGPSHSRPFPSVPSASSWKRGMPLWATWR